MILDFIIAIFTTRYLKKSLQTRVLLPVWDKIFTIIFFTSIALLALSIFFKPAAPVLKWVAHVPLLFLLYVLYVKEEFRTARSYMLAIFPYVLISIAADVIKLFYTRFGNYIDTAIFFSLVWLVAMLIINRRQQKALLKEKLKTKEEEEQNRIMAKRKAELEVQVAERTAEIMFQKEELQEALNELRATQTQLIHSEKMASLGELTAGIAHEIQNPLNFVNNFSEVNKELIEELRIKNEKLKIDDNEVNELLDDIEQNLEKINHHGKRADAIVKGMLQHSRSSSGVKEPTDINALADEYLRLAYHGLRAKDNSFNATMKTDFDETLSADEAG
ncbi:MAG TPA: histidine kinase dimerization/phospho-acceptor domain-containing protein, partial [Chitinophagaceae bacterium]|nr:histidine kinase dimerization/phospho-acceptor domain-containing protein [Chitinophagaceae bacterium]